LKARELIEASARRALKDLRAVKAYDPGRPCEIRVEFVNTDALESYSRKPGTEVIAERTLTCRADDWWTAWRRFFL